MTLPANWNATCGQAYLVNRDDADVTAAFNGFNLFVFVFGTAFTWISVAAFRVMQPKSLWLQKRPFGLLVVQALGVSCFLVNGPGRNINANAFPCDALFWVTNFSIPLMLGPLLARFVMFKTSLDWARVAEHLSLTKLNDVMTVESDDPTPSTAARIRKSLHPSVRKSNAPPSGSAVVVAPTSGGGGGGDDLSSVGGGAERGGTSATGDMSEGGAMSGSASLHMTRSAVARAWFLTSYSFGAILVACCVVPSLAIGVGFYVAEPFYKNGCLGCYYQPVELAVMLAYGNAIATGIFVAAMRVRNEHDPLGIRQEIKIAMLLSVPLGGVSTVLVIIDPFIGRVSERGVFEWEWLVVTAMLWFFMSACPLQVYIAWRGLSAVHDSTLADFVAILNDHTGLRLFTKHCVSEWCVENPKFWSQIKAFKASHSGTPPAKRAALARQIYDVFVKPGSLMEVNLPSVVRGVLDRVFAEEDLKDVPPTLFDTAQHEIVELMRRDSYARWMRTPEYRAWAAESLITDQAGGLRVIPHSTRAPPAMGEAA